MREVCEVLRNTAGSKARLAGGEQLDGNTDFKAAAAAR
jgi:hypothetical protein